MVRVSPASMTSSDGDDETWSGMDLDGAIAAQSSEENSKGEGRLEGIRYIFPE